MKKSINRKVTRKGGIKFIPNRDFLNKAVADYLAHGGKITHIEIDEKTYQDFVATPESPNLVDDFLAGRY